MDVWCEVAGHVPSVVGRLALVTNPDKRSLQVNPLRGMSNFGQSQLKRRSPYQPDSQHCVSFSSIHTYPP